MMPTSFPAIALLATFSNATSGGQADRIQFHLSPGGVQRALLQFHHQSKMNVDFAGEEVQGVYTNGVDGLMVPREALSRLLVGTRLCTSFTSAGSTVSVKSCARVGPVSNQRSELVSEQKIPLEMVTVSATGSSLSGPGPLGVPSATITRDDFDALGIHTTADLIARVLALAGANPLGPRMERSSGLGIAVDVRGQGAGATLILIDGHRLAGSGDQGAFQDFANIPLSSIERVDVLTDGASAQYGSNAVGGVVNVRTLSGAQKSEFKAQLDNGFGSGFRQATLSQVLGHDWSSGSAVATFDYVHSTGWLGPNFVIPKIMDTVYRVPGKELSSGFLHLEQQFPFRTEVKVEGILTHRRAYEMYDTVLATIANAAVSSKTDVVVQMTHIAAQSETRLGTDGVMMTSASRSTEAERQRIYPTSAVYGAGGEIPDAMSNSIFPTSFSMLSRTDQLGIKYDDTLWSYTAGKLKAGLGGEYRRETFNPIDQMGSTASSSRYGRHVSAAFGEISIPLAGGEWSWPALRALEVSVAGRRDWNSDYKGWYTPKYWIRWVPFRGVEIRGSWGRSSQAPNLPNLDTSKNVTFLTFLPDSNSPTGQSAAFVQSGYNSALIAQTATTASLGVRFDWAMTPTSFITAEVNAFRVHFYDRIQSLDPGQVRLSDPRFVGLIDRNITDAEHDQLCGSKQFSGSARECLSTPATTSVNLTLQNIDSSLTHGLELKGDWGAEFGSVRAMMRLQGTLFSRFDEKVTPTSPALSLLRTEKSPEAFQLSSLFSVARGATELDVLWYFSSGFRDDSVGPPLAVAGWTTVDFQVKYIMPSRFGALLGNMAVVVSVRNVADRMLPVFKDSSINQSYDFLSGFAIRRLFSLAIQKQL